MDGQVDPLLGLKDALADRYRFEREVGHGGMATVFLAEDLKHHRPVAIKVLKPEVAAAVGPARFVREIEIAANLVHPNLLPLYDSGQAAGSLYYVMPYFDGETLRDRLIRVKQLSLDEAINIVCDVADGLEHAHAHDIVHRDIKPENILLQGERAVLADFGIARAISMSAKDSLTSSGVVIGTAQYMSPEQGLGENEVGARSDVYSTGCVLYEMLAGEPPFTGPSLQAIIVRHSAADIPSLRLLRPDVPPEIDAIVRKSLGKVPAARFPSAAAFAKSLRSFRSVRTRWALASKGRVAGLAGAALIVVVGGLFLAKNIFAGPLTRNDWILVADFEGPSADPTLAAAFRDLVTAALAQSQFVRVLERRQLNEIMRQAGIPETTFVDLELGKQLAARSSVRAVLLGSIRPFGTGYSLVLHVVSPETGGALASVAATAPGPDWRSSLVSAAETEVNELRKQLGERRSEIAANRPLRDVATPSFAAFRHYSEALDRSLIKGDFSGSNDLLSRAIALDSAFASAWVTRGSNYLTTRQLDSARFAYSRALAYPHRLSPAETYRLRGDAAYALDHDVAGAVRWYDLYLAEVPHSRSGRSNRALYRTALGDYENALKDLEQAVAANPFGPELIQPTLLNLAAVQIVLGRNAAARETAKGLSGPFAEYLQIMLASAESRWPVADSISRRVSGRAGTRGVFLINAVTSHASALAAMGGIKSADSVLEQGAAVSRGATARWFERARLLLAIASETSVSNRTDILSADTTLAAATLRNLWRAVAGDTVSASAEAVSRRRRLSRRDLAMIGTAPILIEGWSAARANDWRGAIDRVGEAALNGEYDPTILDRPDNYMLRWLAATGYDRVGNPDSSAVYLNLILQPLNMPPGHYALRGISYGFAHRHLARIEQRRGNAAIAARHLDAFLLSFTRPDEATSSLVVAAREERARSTNIRGSGTDRVSGREAGK